MNTRARFLLLIAGTWVFQGTSTAFAQAAWIGESVVYTKPSRDVKFGDVVEGKQVYFPFSGIMPIKVRDDREGWLRIFDGDREGWVPKADFVLVRDAPAYFNRRVHADPRDTFALYMRGEGWLRNGELDFAIMDFDVCIRLNPTDVKAFNSRGLAWSNKKNYDQAIRDYGAAIRLDPAYALAFNNRGLVWRIKKDYAKAIRDFDDAIRHDPKLAMAINNKAYLLATCADDNLRDVARAQELMIEAVKLRGASPYNEQTLGAIAAAQGRFADAIKHQKTALEDRTYAKTEGTKALERLKWYEEMKPYRE
ncbi:MAG TPA: tetratricopeptide repeat protein [Gemmataceae bacterium]|jgi:tetratricopeptide (TPR) repeat protein|nr:tetratricopeptide repeat protein [Gemmataceae bacterium]